VASGTDSRVILDQPGAERLLGKGDMLYMSGDSPAPLRLQGVFVSDMEINNVNRYWRTQRPDEAPQTPITQLVADDKPAEARSVMPKQEAFVQPSTQSQSGQRAFWDADDDLTDREKEAQSQEDELYDEAVELVRRLKKASVSLLQRRLRIGYTRAARLIDVMEAEGIVGPPTEGSKPRAVLPPKK
jgi:S-DNA-T family DNA segregation ATPase FtsK/SpoIIIE